MDQRLLTVVAEMYAKPGREEELGELLRALIAPTKKEVGCVQYDLYLDNDSPAHFLFIENWTSMAHLQAHLSSPHFIAFQARSPDLLAEPQRIVFAKRIE